jgi:hypothetical protein
VALVRSPEARAVVLFVGACLPSASTPFHFNLIYLTHATIRTTRNPFNGQAVATLSYSAYRAKCEQAMNTIGRDTKERFALTAIAIAPARRRQRG